MGSQFIDIHIADPDRVHAVVRGDQPELFATMAASDDPPADALRPAFDVMEQGTFCFLPKAVAHPQGIVYCRAVEAILKAVGTRRVGIECYPDESVSLLWELAFGPCEADWLTLPHDDSGVGVIAWRSPRAAASLGSTAARLAETGEFEPRYVSSATLAEIAQVCAEASRGGGIFTIYQA